MKKSDAEIAKIVHNINREYRKGINEDPGAEYKDISNQTFNSIMSGINSVRTNPKGSGEDSHRTWLSYMTRAGWVYGKVKNEEAKTHPCIVDYDDLPSEQKTKDDLFRLIVLTFI